MENEFNKIAVQSKKFKTVQGIMGFINEETLIKQHSKQPKGKAVGVDGITKNDYEIDINENINKLVKRMKKFSYKPKPVRRVFIPKANGELRPLGIPSYEDKLVQGVMRNILDNVYEHRFIDSSYGFRKNRNAHQAVKEVNQIIMRKKINYIVDADIKGFFDNVNHEWLMKFLENDIEDKNFLRYIKRFLKGGVMDDLIFHDSDKGTPQGGLISPVLANVYLHYVLDLWFDKFIKKQAKGEAHMVRYADDFVCMFQYENEAKSFYKVLIERLRKFELEIAEDKSKIIPFGRFARENNEEVETFDFLGFTYINGETITGKYRVVLRTSRKKLKAKKKVFKEWLKQNMHMNVLKLIEKINKKLRGHYAYYGVSGNYEGLNKFYKYIEITLYKILKRRSQRAFLTYKRYLKLLKKHPIIEPKLYVNIW